MGHDPERDVGSWLQAEAEGRDDAEARLRVVFARQVRRLTPPDVLAARIMRDIAAQRSPAVRPAAAPGWLAAAALGLLVLGGLAAAAFWSAWVPGLAGALAGLSRAVPLLMVLGGLMVDALGHGWTVFLSIAKALALVVTTGPGFAAIVLNLTIALGASLALGRLVATQSIEEGESPCGRS
jgi:hypothetical protein